MSINGINGGTPNSISSRVSVNVTGAKQSPLGASPPGDTLTSSIVSLSGAGGAATASYAATSVFGSNSKAGAGPFATTGGIDLNKNSVGNIR